MAYVHLDCLILLYFTLFGLCRDSENLADLVRTAMKLSFCVEAGVAFGCLRITGV